MNTRLSGSARFDDIKSHPQGEIRGRTKLVNIIEDVRKCASEQSIAESEALESELTAKTKEFTENGGEVYAKA